MNIFLRDYDFKKLISGQVVNATRTHAGDHVRIQIMLSDIGYDRMIELIRAAAASGRPGGQP